MIHGFKGAVSCQLFLKVTSWKRTVTQLPSSATFTYDLPSSATLIFSVNQYYSHEHILFLNQPSPVMIADRFVVICALIVWLLWPPWPLHTLGKSPPLLRPPKITFPRLNGLRTVTTPRTAHAGCYHRPGSAQSSSDRCYTQWSTAPRNGTGCHLQTKD